VVYGSEIELFQGIRLPHMGVSIPSGKENHRLPIRLDVKGVVHLQNPTFNDAFLVSN
jgi:hypothetical protein